MDDDVDPGLPIKLHPCSNGEFVPPPASPLVRETARRMRGEADGAARRLGMSRRRFLLSSMGAASMLTILSACASDQARHDGSGAPGGTFAVPPEAGTDPAAATDALGGDEFVFDVQGHFLDYSHDVGAPVPDFPQSGCGADDPHDCYSADRFLDLIFNQSDTSMVVLSALPFAGNPLAPDVMARTIDLADRVCGDHRVLMQGEAHPSDGPLEGVLATMADLASRYRIGAWKVYCHAGGPGWYLDDHDLGAPRSARRSSSRPAPSAPRSWPCTRGSRVAAPTPARSTSGRRPPPTPSCRSSSTTRGSRPSTPRSPTTVRRAPGRRRGSIA